MLILHISCSPAGELLLWAEGKVDEIPSVDDSLPEDMPVPFFYGVEFAHVKQTPASSLHDAWMSALTCEKPALGWKNPGEIA